MNKLVYLHYSANPLIIIQTFQFRRDWTLEDKANKFDNADNDIK